MTDPGYGSSRSALKRAEHGLEGVIFNSRWLMAPFYLGLIVSLVVLLFKFLYLLYEFITHAWSASESDVILGVLSLIDVTLTGNLVLIVVFSGYENFVSRIDPAGHPDWPAWMARIDFAGTVSVRVAKGPRRDVAAPGLSLDEHIDRHQERVGRALNHAPRQRAHAAPSTAFDIAGKLCECEE